jgi:hypothetical protein
VGITADERAVCNKRPFLDGYTDSAMQHCTLQQQQAHMQALQQFARPGVPGMSPFAASPGMAPSVASMSMQNLAARPTGSVPARPQV